MAQQPHTTKKKLETAVLIGVHAQTDNQFNFDSTKIGRASCRERV